MDLTVIIVSTNERHYVEPCLRSIYAQTKGIEFEVIVVDNASTDGTPDMISEKFPEAICLRNSANRGFAASNNRGIIQAKGKFVLLLNPDTELVGNALTETVELMRNRPEIGISGCRLILPSGDVQGSVLSFPTLWNVFCEATFLYRFLPRTRLFGEYYMSYFDFDRDMKVDWVCGAYMMIRREVIERIGILDEQFFLYSEETDFCYRAAQAGFPTWFFAKPAIRHFWGGMNAFSRRTIVWTIGSQLIYFRKHFTGIRRAALIALKHSGTALRTLVFAGWGAVTLNKRMLEKSKVYGYATMRLFSRQWTYQSAHVGIVAPWRI